MTTTAEDRALELLTDYRAAWNALHDEDVNKVSEFWYVRGWFYIWAAIRLENGVVVKGTIKPLMVRGSQLPRMTETLRRRKEVQDEGAAHHRPRGLTLS